MLTKTSTQACTKILFPDPRDPVEDPSSALRFSAKKSVISFLGGSLTIGFGGGGRIWTSSSEPPSTRLRFGGDAMTWTSSLDSISSSRCLFAARRAARSSSSFLRYSELSAAVSAIIFYGVAAAVAHEGGEAQGCCVLRE